MPGCDSRVVSSLLILMLWCNVGSTWAQAPPSQYTYLEGHKAPVYAVAYTADGKTILSGSVDGTIHAWDAATGKLIRTIHENKGPVLTLAVSRDNLRFAAAGIDRRVRLFDVPSQHPLAQMTGVPGQGTSIAVSRDGRTLFTGDAAKVLRLWNVDNNAALRDYAGSTGEITGIAILPETRTVLAASRDGGLRSWNIDNAVVGPAVVVPSANSLSADINGTKLAVAGEDGVVRLVTWPAALPVQFATHGDQVTSVAVSGDGQWILTGALDSQLVIAKGSDGTGPRGLPGQPGKTTAVTLSPDGLLAASGSETGLVKFWNTLDAADRSQIGGHTGAIHGLAFHPTKPLIASSGADSTVRLWRIPAPSRQLPGHSGALTVAAVAPDGSVAATAAADRSIRLYKAADGAVMRAIEQLPQPATAIAFSTDGKRMAFGDAAGSIRIENAADGKDAATLGAHVAGVSGLAFHPDGKRLVSSGLDGSLKIWTIPAATTAIVSTHGEVPAAIAIAADGKLVLSGSNDGQVRLTDPTKEKDKGTRVLEGKLGPVTAAGLSPDNALAAASDNTGLVRVWNAADGADRLSVAGHTGAVNALQFAPGKLTQFATAGADGTTRIWRFPAPPVALAAHQKGVLATATSGDGKLAITGGADGLAQLWTLVDGKPSKALAGGEAAVHSVALRKDAIDAMTGDAAGIARISNPADGALRGLIGAHDGIVAGVALHPTQPLAATAGADGAVKIWQLPLTPVAEVAKHADAVTTVALSSDGATIVSAGIDKSIKASASGGVRQLGVNFATAVRCLALSADNSWVAAGADAGEIRLLNVADGAVRGTFTGHPGGTTGVAIHPNGQLVASVGADGALRLWDSAKFAAEPVKMAMVSPMPLTSVAFTPDGNAILTGGMDKSVKLWNSADLAAVRAYDGCTDAVTSVAFTKDAQKVMAASADKSVRVWAVAAPQPALTIAHPAAVRSVHPSADNLRLVTGSDDNAVRVFDLATGKLVQRFADATKAVVAVAFAPDGKSVVSGSADFSVRRSALAIKAMVAPAHEGGATCVAFSPDGSHLLSGGADKLVRMIDLNGAAVRTFTAEAPVRCFAVRNDSLQLTAGCDNAFFYQFTYANAALERKVQTPAAVTSAAYSLDNTRLAIAGTDNALRVYQPTDALPLELVATPASATSIAFGPDNGTLLAGYPDNAARLHALSLVRHFAGHTGAVTAVAWSPDGASLFTGGIDKAIFQWNVQTGQQTRPFAGHTDAIAGLAVSMDGARLISASPDKTLRTWTIASGAAAASIALPAPARTLSVSVDGNRAVATADDNVLRVWDLVAGREIEHVAGHEGGTSRAALSADGRIVASTGADKNVRTWSPSLETLVPADAMKLHDMALLADGSHAVTSGEDKVVKLWDMTGKLVRQYGGLAAAAKNLAVSRDGMFIAAGGDPLNTQAQLLIWRTSDAGAVFNQPLASPITALGFSGEGRLAVASADKHVRVFSPAETLLLEDSIHAPVFFDLAFLSDNATFLGAGNDNFGHLASLSLVRHLKGHAGVVRSVAFIPGAEQLISAGDDKTIRQWNLADGQPVRTYSGSTAAVSSVSVSKDGTTLAAGGGEVGVRLWKIPAADDKTADVPAASTLMHPAAVAGVSLTADGARLATACNDGFCRLWDTRNGRELERFVGHTGVINAVAFSQDGRFVVTGGADRTGRRWTPAVAAAIPAHEGRAADARLSPDGTRVFSAGADKTVAEFETATGKLVRRYEGATLPLRSVAPTPDGKFVVAGGEDKVVRVWNAADGSSVAAFETPDVVAQLQATAGARTVLAAGNDKIVRNLSLTLRDGKPALEIVHEGIGHTAAVAGVALAGDDHTLYSVSPDQTVRRWHAASYTSLVAMDGHTGPVYALEFSPDNKLLASAGADKSVRVWTAADGKPAFVAQGHTRQVCAVAFSPNGKELASAGLDATIRLWNAVVPEPPKEGAPAPKPDPKKPDEPKPLAPGELIGQYDEEVDGPLYAVAWSRDGNSLLSAGAAKTWQSWARKEFKAMKTFIGHNHTIYRFSYNPSGSRFATLDNAGQLMIWNAADGALVYHQQLPAATAWSFAYAPTGTEIVVATSDPRVIRVALPPAAQ